MNLTLPSGQITAIVGPNGSGKSTLLRGLARLLRPHQGDIYLNDVSIFELSPREFAQQVGILPQNPTAPEGLTIAQLVTQGRYPYQGWWRSLSEIDRQIITEALTLTGLETLKNSPIQSLSGGQRQCAWIAMILSQNPSVLLLDEPTTFLDLAHQIEVLELLRQLNQSQRRTIVMVLHDLNQACRYANFLIAIREGRIVAQGQPTEIMTVQTVKQLFNVSSKILLDPITDTPMCITVPSQKI